MRRTSTGARSIPKRTGNAGRAAIASMGVALLLWVVGFLVYLASKQTADTPYDGDGVRGVEAHELGVPPAAESLNTLADALLDGTADLDQILSALGTTVHRGVRTDCMAVDGQGWVTIPVETAAPLQSASIVLRLEDGVLRQFDFTASITVDARRGFPESRSTEKNLTIQLAFEDLRPRYCTALAQLLLHHTGAAFDRVEGMGSVVVGGACRVFPDALYRQHLLLSVSKDAGGMESWRTRRTPETSEVAPSLADGRIEALLLALQAMVASHSVPEGLEALQPQQGRKKT